MTTDCTHTNIQIQQLLESIHTLNPKKTIFRIDEGPYIDLLEKLGNPHLNCPPVIHVAGTNGKGSTIAFLKSLYEAEGKIVHAYNSPHLLTFNERITLAGHHIDDERLLHYLDLIETTNDGAPLTFFEYTTALAFKVFADHPADILLLETGLGGRLDCTNVIPDPIATIITPIGYDHMDWLGNDIKTIAGEKAGIMKPNVPCFIAPQKHDVNDLFEQKAIDIGCDIHFVERLDDLPDLGLIGDHQKDNASVAINVFNFTTEKDRDKQRDNKGKKLCLPLSSSVVKEALAKTYWPARMEKICPRLDRGSSQTKCPEIWFDCGHNADGAQAIADQLKAWKNENSNRKIHLILGLAADKNPNEFLTPLTPYINKITCVDLINARNPQTADELANKIELEHTTSTSQTINQAIEKDTDSGDIIFITGSLYLYEQIKV